MRKSRSLPLARFFLSRPLTNIQRTGRIPGARAKRERCHASQTEQARRIRPSASPPAPMKCSVNAARAQVNMNSLGVRRGCLEEERWCCEVAPGHLKRVRRTPQRDSSRDYQAQPHGGRAMQCFLSRWTCFDDKPCCSQQCCRFHGARHMLHCFPAPACGLLYVVCTVFDSVIGCGRTKCA